MKYKCTKREVNSRYAVKIKVSYCRLDNLLCEENPVAYTSGVNGWNADVYEVSDGVAIITGYSPFGNVTPKYELLKKYEDMGRAIRCDYSLTWQERREKLHSLVLEFCDEARREG